MPNIDITPEQWRIVSNILQKHLPEKEVWAFGSRAKFQAKPFSDLDLAIISDQALPLHLLATLQEEFTTSDLPFKVDLVDWVTISFAFRKIIEDHGIVIK